MATNNRLVIKDINQAPHRAYLHGLGLNRRDFNKPFIAVINTWNEISLSNCHLNETVRSIKAGILAADGIPFEINTLAISDGYAAAHDGVNYVLPSRELIADSIEVMVRAHGFNGMVVLAGGDKPIPAALMAMLRLDIPAILINGGNRYPTKYHGKLIDYSDVIESVGDFQIGKVREDAVYDKEEAAFSGAGDDAGMLTPSTMACLAEALGLSLPYSSTAAATSSKKLRHARYVGQLICRLVETGLTPRKIVTRQSLENAITLGMAISGTANMILHLLAIAREGGLPLSLDDFDRIGRRTPVICPISPLGKSFITDLDNAGGIPAVMSNLSDLLDLTQLTITGKTIEENICNAAVYDDQIIRKPELPYYPESSLIILKGNLAPQGAVARQTTISQNLRKHKGQAKVYNVEEDAIQAIAKGQIERGDVIVLRNQGPKGGPGMPEISSLTATINRVGLTDSVYLLTDGRLHGAAKGACVGHIGPEAVEAGPLAVIETGDMITIDLDQRLLQLHVDEAELAGRLSVWQRPRQQIPDRLHRYAKLVGPACEGAVLS